MLIDHISYNSRCREYHHPQPYIPPSTSYTTHLTRRLAGANYRTYTTYRFRNSSSSPSHIDIIGILVIPGEISIATTNQVQRVLPSAYSNNCWNDNNDVEVREMPFDNAGRAGENWPALSQHQLAFTNTNEVTHTYPHSIEGEWFQLY